MLPRSLVSIFCVLILANSQRTPAVAFSDVGHHVISVLAYEMLSPGERAEIMRVLRANPRYAQDFTAPESIRGDGEAVARWQIGVAGEWPDVIRSVPELTRPSWHYQLGHNLVLGSATAPAYPGPLPAGATLDSQDLNIVQAINLCSRVWHDRNQSDADRAIALCWLCHLVADLHQPCHAGSLYSPVAFPDGDRGANSIKVSNGKNMHALWDGLLGRNANPGEVMRRVQEISSDPVAQLAATYAVDDPADLLPETWEKESRSAAIRFVYTEDVLAAVMRVERGLTTDLEEVALTEEYLQAAGRVAKLRAAQAAHRLAYLIRQPTQPQ